MVLWSGRSQGQQEVLLVPVAMFYRGQQMTMKRMCQGHQHSTRHRVHRNQRRKKCWESPGPCTPSPVSGSHISLTAPMGLSPTSVLHISLWQRRWCLAVDVPATLLHWNTPQLRGIWSLLLFGWYNRLTSIFIHNHLSGILGYSFSSCRQYWIWFLTASFW